MSTAEMATAMCVKYVFMGLFVLKNVLTIGIPHVYNGTNVSKEYPVMPKSWLARTFLIHEGSDCICNIEDQRIAKNSLKKTPNLNLYSHWNQSDYQPINFSMPLCPRELCPSFQPDYGDEEKNKTKSDLSSVETYGYSTLAVLLISLCSIAGVLLIPCLRSRIYKYVITGFIAFGLGFMIGDAVLHLIPEAIGNECNGDHHHHTALWRQVLIMLTIFGLFTFETVMDLAHHEDKTSHRCPRRHSHSHIPFPEDILPWSEGKPTCSSPGHPETPSSSCGAGGAVPVTFILHDTDTTNFQELKPLAMVILLGDAVHNFGDGLAVGAAFTSGLQSGISTSLAIFCHELPHEFGDFVILRSTGLSIQYALLANLASALTAFLGLFVGVSLGFDQSTRQWIFAFTAAMFLYIAVGDMLPELRNHNKSFSVLAVQSACMLIGMGIVLLMHLYVEKQF